MPAPLLLVVLLASLLVGCVPGGARSDGVRTPDAPFTLTALDVDQPRFRIRCLTVRRSSSWEFCGGHSA